MSAIKIDPSSFRDPSGFVFSSEDEIFRAISSSYFENFSHFISSGLYASLVSDKLITEHAEAENILPQEYSNYKIIKPKKIPFISYPYEWSFLQLKEAALLTLRILKNSLSYGMILKDASAYNVQFIGHDPIFIDTLSFEKHIDGSPWKAYAQFCRHFLAPLALMSYRSPELNSLLKNFIDGIPLDITSFLLPSKSIFNSGISAHILLHSKFQKKQTGENELAQKKVSLSKPKLTALIQHLEDCISALTIKEKKSTWTDYETNNSYSDNAEKHKEELVSKWLETIKPNTVIDAGCNTGKYSLLAAGKAKYVIALDSDFLCIENLYSKLKKSEIKNCLPLHINLSNPSPAIGWANKERKTITQRGNADVLLALALVHHLRIGNNVPFLLIAEYFAALTDILIIEFVPATDKMVQLMKLGKEDILDDYTIENFYSSFEKFFTLEEEKLLNDSGRTLIRMKNKSR